MESVTRQRMNYQPSTPTVYEKDVILSSAQNKTMSKYPSEVSKFTTLLHDTAQQNSMNVEVWLMSETPHGDAGWSSVRYRWCRSQEQNTDSISDIAKTITNTALCRADWADSVIVEEFRLSEKDANQCHMTVKIRVGNNIRRWYQLKVGVLCSLVVGLAISWAIALHILGHIFHII